jgi:hypothetical protein
MEQLETKMPLCAYLLPEPWSLLNGDAIMIDASTCEVAVETFYRSLVVPEDTQILINQKVVPTDKLSSTFIFEGRVFRRFFLPIEKWKESGEEWYIELEKNKKKIGFKLTPAKSVHSLDAIRFLIRWQIDNFLELNSLEVKSTLGEERFGCLTRLSWQTAQQFWLSIAENDFHERFSLIVKFAKDSFLNKAINFALRTPNKILKRERTLQNIAAAQEFDAGCLRWYIQQPGKTLQEKAGPKQKILSISRHEQFDLLENRVSKWLCDKLSLLSHSYLRDNHGYNTTEKYLLVKNFEAGIRSLLVNSPLSYLPNSECSCKPNMVLMQHAHYRHIWRVYQELRSQKKLEDDCWRWQTNLWTETGRQLMGAVLSFAASALSSFSLLGNSFIYLKQEQMDGHWHGLPIAPGPFLTPHGLVEYFDLEDGDIDSPLRDWMLSVGCQQVLRQQREEGFELLMPIWFWHVMADEQKLDEYRSRCLEALQISLPLLDGRHFKVKGILISTDWEGSQADATLTASCVSLRWLRLSRHHDQNVKILLPLAKEIGAFFC